MTLAGMMIVENKGNVFQNIHLIQAFTLLTPEWNETYQLVSRITFFLGSVSYFQTTDLAGLPKQTLKLNPFLGASCNWCSICWSACEDVSCSRLMISVAPSAVLCCTPSIYHDMKQKSFNNPDVLPPPGVVWQKDQLHSLPGCDVNGGLHLGTGWQVSILAQRENNVL